MSKKKRDTYWDDPYMAAVMELTGFAPKEVDEKNADMLRKHFVIEAKANLPAQDSILVDDGYGPHPRIKSGGAALPIRGTSPEYAEGLARHYLALAQWLREHPPVDQQQVEALARLLTLRAPTPYNLARDLVESGVRVEGATS